MRINVLFFGITRDLVGSASMDVDLADGATLSDLKKRLLADHSELNDYGIAFAVNEHYAELDHLLNNDDIVALIPPVSGG